MTSTERHPHAHDAPADASGPAARVAALESLLVARGVVSPDSVDALVEWARDRVGPRNGARVVARAWVDKAYRSRLRKDGTAAIAELGYGGPEGAHLVAVENTASVHNVVVCTLCSCYPWPVLGLPPVWYKSAPYRSRVVREPRAVLREFGVELDPDVTVRVWDSTAETRYLVVPMRPAGSDELDEDALAALVTRDSMIGTGLPLQP
jgi:nitrile hydratase